VYIEGLADHDIIICNEKGLGKGHWEYVRQLTQQNHSNSES